jgi:hypothetical protein
VGQLKRGRRRKKNKSSTEEKPRPYRVHVPAARGRVIPKIDSMSDDLPAL